MTKEHLDEMLKVSVLMAHFRLTNMTARKHMAIGAPAYFWVVWPVDRPNEIYLAYSPEHDPTVTPVDVAPVSDAAEARLAALGKDFDEWWGPLAVHEQFAFTLRAELKVQRYERPKNPAFPKHLPN